MQFEKIAKKQFGVDWHLIFHHNAKENVYFTKNSEKLLFCNETQRFSILGTLTNNYKINGYFEFLIEYPEISYLIHWRQKKNPIKYNSDIGFVPLHVPLTSNKFVGLALSNYYNGSTFLHGNVGSNSWFYSIGAYHGWLSDGSFPGPNIADENKNSIGVFIVSLYVRIRRFISCKIMRKQKFNVELMIFLLIY